MPAQDHNPAIRYASGTLDKSLIVGTLEVWIKGQQRLTAQYPLTAEQARRITVLMEKLTHEVQGRDNQANSDLRLVREGQRQLGKSP